MALKKLDFDGSTFWIPDDTLIYVSGVCEELVGGLYEDGRFYFEYSFGATKNKAIYSDKEKAENHRLTLIELIDGLFTEKFFQE